MNTRQPIKKNRLLNIISLILGVILLVLIGFYGHLNRAASATGTPENFLTDLNGNKTATLKLNQEGILDLRVYGEGNNDQSAKNDLVFALDNSAAMQTPLKGSTSTKLADAKAAIKSFINQVDPTGDFEIGLVSYHADESTKAGLAETIDLTPISSVQDKTSLAATVDAIQAPQTGLRGNGIGAGVKAADDELLSTRSRADAKKTIVLLNSSQEFSTPYSVGGNGVFESNADLSDVNLAPADDSELSRANSNNISIFGTFYSDDLSSIKNTGAALTRFMSAKTNNISLPSGFSWDGDYNATNQTGLNNVVDNNYFYSLSSPDNLLAIFSDIFYRVCLVGGAKVNTIEKLASNVKYEQTLSATDKGGRTYAVAQTQIGTNQYSFAIDSLPDQYICMSQETDCLRAASEISTGVDKGKFQITGNFLDIKIKIIGNLTGSFDMSSNFSGCQGGALAKIAQDSKVEYLDPKSGTIFQSFDFPVLCLSISQGNPKILKTLFKVSGTNQDILTEGASFEAGDQVDVKLEIDEPDEFRSDYRIQDTLPSFVKGTIKYSLTLPTGQKIDNLDPTIDGNNIVFSGSSQTVLQRGRNFIEYRFRI